jgi:hypothetical protein
VPRIQNELSGNEGIGSNGCAPEHHANIELEGQSANEEINREDWAEASNSTCHGIVRRSGFSIRDPTK